MNSSTVATIYKAAQAKLGYSSGKAKFFVLSMLAGVFTAIGNIFSYSAGAIVYSQPSVANLYPFAIALPYVLSIMLAVFVGAELFLGNIMYMCVAVLEKRGGVLKAFLLLVFCYIGNTLGNVITCGIYVASGLANPNIQLLAGLAAQGKLAASFAEMFVRAALGSMVIGLVVWVCNTLKSESAKILSIFFLINAFMVSAFENCIANAGTFTLAFLFAKLDVGLVQFATTSFATFAGNIFGGFLFAALPLWFAKKGS